MKTAFAAALALSLLSGTAIAAPNDTRSDQGQSRPDRGDNQDRAGQDRSGQDRSGGGQNRPDRGDQQGQNNSNGQGNGGGQAQNNGNGQGNGGGQAHNNGNGQGNGNGHAQNQNQNQNQNNSNGHWGQNNGGNHWTQNNGGRDHDARPQAQRQYSYNGRNYNAVRGPVWNAPRGYDARRVWNRGDRLPEGYRHRAYVVDYRAYHLARPSYGYQWVRVGNSVYLVRASNGVVAQIVWNLFY